MRVLGRRPGAGRVAVAEREAGASPSGGWVIEEVRRSHDRAAFSCGYPVLDAFIARYARQNQEVGTSRTYVARPAGSQRVDGYYSIAAGSLRLASIPKGQRNHLTIHAVPIALLGRLAVRSESQGMGLGSILLMDALRRACRAADAIGIHAVEVDAIDDAAAAFYRRFGFLPLTDEPRHLYLPMRTLRRLIDV